MPDPEIKVFDSRDALFQAAAERFARQAISSVALSGGSTPGALFDLLAQEPWRSRIDWPNLGVYWGDERCVPPTDDQSNYKLADDHLLSKVPARRVYRMKGELDPAQAAAEYERELPPNGFDVALQGLGSNSHTASLFPHTDALKVVDRRVVANWVAEVNMWRLTITIPELQRAKHILFLATGADKADAIRTVIKGPLNVDEYPAQVVRAAQGTVSWFLDEPAASKL
ncbi:MAG TPA: 6-phosphogluconolactonase [Chloroflexota bacterium]|jgi:6-phosphogluconolactonase|nr:6-phosphogluconolactonase [Chloroflexota bacterium]